MVFAIKFGSPDEASEEEYALRDGWGSEINTAVSGDTVYVEGGDLAKKVVNDWYPSNKTELVNPPEDIAKMLHGADEAVHCGVKDLEAVPAKKLESVDFDAPHFKPREYEGEYISYTLYGLDSDGDELDDIITSPKKSTVIHTIKELLPDYRRIYNGMHVVAILYDENDNMLDSEVVWSTDQDESKGANETIEYEKGHKNSRGEDAPWVIRDHKNGKVLASFSKKDDAENHMKTMKRYSKSEGRFTEIKAAIKAAWSAAEAKWFRLDFQESTERLDVYPIASDNEGVGVNWGVLPERNTIVQYATDLRTGNNEIEREMPYKDLDELEEIFVDEFKSMDETLEVGADNGADIHPLTESGLNDYKAAVKAAWSASGAKNFKIDHSDGSNKSLNVWPKALDGNFYDVSWRIMPVLGIVVQYADDENGDKDIEREIPFKDVADIEAIFTDLFKRLDNVLERGKIQESKEGTEKQETAANPRWYVEFGDIYNNVKKEYYDTEADAKARYDELAGRGDIEWVEDPGVEGVAKEEKPSYDDYAESVKSILMGREFEYGPETANEFVGADYKEIVRKNFDAGKNAFAAAADIDDAYMGKE